MTAEWVNGYKGILHRTQDKGVGQQRVKIKSIRLFDLTQGTW